jgi:hypothetical protein
LAVNRTIPQIQVQPTAAEMLGKNEARPLRAPANTVHISVPLLQRWEIPVRVGLPEVEDMRVRHGSAEASIQQQQQRSRSDAAAPGR